MKASHKLPTGKYYGTEVTFDLGDGDVVEFTVWKSDDPMPSERQLRAWGMNAEEAAYKNKMRDSHFESETAFNICKVKTKRLH